MALKNALLSLSLAFEQTGANDFGGPEFKPELRKTLRFGPGTTSGNADLAWIDHREIVASGNDDIDLAGVLTDAFGQVITAAEIVGIVVTADADNVNDVLIGGGTNVFAGLWGASGDIAKVKPNGVFANVGFNAAGLGAVVAGTGDILRISNGGAGTSVKYSIAILARSA